MIAPATETNGVVLFLGKQRHAFLTTESFGGRSPAPERALRHSSPSQERMVARPFGAGLVLFGRGKVQMSNWITVEPLQLEIDNSPHAEYFPDSPGCYVIYLDGKLTYIGQTTSLLKRLRSYQLNYARYCSDIVTPWGRCRKLIVKYRVPKRYGEWAMTELRLIKRLQPAFNCVGSVKKRRPNK